MFILLFVTYNNILDTGEKTPVYNKNKFVKIKPQTYLQVYMKYGNCTLCIMKNN